MFDWSQVQVFLAVAERGSLSAAARSLGTSQPTVGRHIHAMEIATGTPLFSRYAQGMVLTEAGSALLEPARAMQKAAKLLEMKAAGTDAATSGTVRITASIFASHHILPPIIAKIREQEPEIAIELAPSDATENLLFREADIAVRMYRPTQLEMVTRHIGDLPLGLFAAVSYLDRRGRPTTRDELMEHDFVGYDRNESIVRGFQDHGMSVDRSFFRTRCDHQTTYWELVRSGCGIGFAQIDTVSDDPLVEHLDVGLEVPSLPVWLTTHSGLRHTPRVAKVWDHLAAGLERACRLTGT